MKPINTLCLIASMTILAVSAQATLLVNGGYTSDYDFVQDHATGRDVTLPITVAAADLNFQEAVGSWARKQAGDYGDIGPGGTGNDSDFAVAFRKGYGTLQMLSLNTVTAGDQLQLDWDYYVPESVPGDVAFHVNIFGVNEATGIEAPTQILSINGTAPTFGGEASNYSILATSSVTVLDANGVDPWQSATSLIFTVTDQWDYIGINVNRGIGVGNNNLQQVDNFSLTTVPESSSLVLLGASVFGFVLLNLRRKK